MQRVHGSPLVSDIATDWAKQFAATVEGVAQAGKVKGRHAYEVEHRPGNDPSHIFGAEIREFVKAHGGNAPAGAAYQWAYQYAHGRFAEVADNRGRVTPEGAAKLPENLRGDFEVMTRTSTRKFQGETTAVGLARVANGLLYVSGETESQYQPVSLNRNKKFKLDEAAIRKLVGATPGQDIEIKINRNFFRDEAKSFADTAKEYETAPRGETAEARASRLDMLKYYRGLEQQAMIVHKAVTRALVGDIQVVDTNPFGDQGAMYILGRTKNGDVAGLTATYAS